jgi:hypothetical protein
VTVDPLTWSTPEVVTTAARKEWVKGTLLTDLVRDPEQYQRFPLRVRIHGPAPIDVPNAFEDVVSWARTWNTAAADAQWRLLTKRVPVRHLGAQQLPTAAFLDTPSDALALLGPDERHQASEYLTTWSATNSRMPSALPVLRARPHDVIAAGDDWELLLEVAHWLTDNPRPGIHPREIPVAGVHSKLVELHEGLLTRLLNQVLATETIDEESDTFAGRYGLDGTTTSMWLRGEGQMLGLGHLPVVEVAWPPDALDGIDPQARGIREVLIVENRRSFSTTPLPAGRLVIWGVGNRASALLTAGWLRDVPILYWGDCDTYGLLILARVRAVLPHVSSVLMNTETLDRHRHRLGIEPKPVTDPIPGLTTGEQDLLDALRATPGTRLEQEHLNRIDIINELGRSQSGSQKLPPGL